MVQCLCDNGALHGSIVRLARVGTHRDQWRYCTRRPVLSHNRRERGDDNGRDPCLLNRSLHNHGRAVTRASASCHEHGIHALGLQGLRDSRPGDVRQHVHISPSPHKADVRWCHLFDHTCLS